MVEVKKCLACRWREMFGLHPVHDCDRARIQPMTWAEAKVTWNTCQYCGLDYTGPKCPNEWQAITLDEHRMKEAQAVAKVGEFYIASIKPAWEKDRYQVREKMGIDVGNWRRVGSSQSHYQAVRIMEALTDQAKRDVLSGLDVHREQEKILQEKLTAYAWQFASESMLKEIEESEKKKKAEDAKQAARDNIAAQFVAGKLTFQMPKGAVIVTKENGMHICTHRGGGAGLTITIE